MAHGVREGSPENGTPFLLSESSYFTTGRTAQARCLRRDHHLPGKTCSLIPDATVREANRRALRGAAEDHAEFAAAEHPLGLALQLADPFPGDAELVAKLGERRGVAVAEAVAADQDVPVALG
jgi:hypothetical protein